MSNENRTEPAQIKRPERTKIRSLSVTVNVPEGADVAELLSRASELGDVTNLSFHEYAGYAEDALPY
jgi:hypothetical protein